MKGPAVGRGLSWEKLGKVGVGNKKMNMIMFHCIHT